MDYSKLVIGLSSVFTGWILAQFTGVFKEWLNTKKIKKCLFQELSELQQELERTLLIYSRQLQIHALAGIDNGSATPISSHIFKNYYKDAVLSLNKHQRLSFQLIHTLTDNINEGIVELRILTNELQSKHMLEGPKSITKEDIELWGKKVICEFTNVATVMWHIKFHISKPKDPDLSAYSKEHEEYLKYLESIEFEILKIIEEAKSLGREQFEAKYNPEIFAGKFN